MKIRKLIDLLSKDGWHLYRKTEKFYQFTHPIKLGLITIYGNKSRKLALWSLKNILIRAGLI